MRMGRIELPLRCRNQILSLARLPIPPHPQLGPSAIFRAGYTRKDTRAAFSSRKERGSYSIRLEGQRTAASFHRRKGPPVPPSSKFLIIGLI